MALERNKLLNKLKSIDGIHVGGFVMTYDMGLQFDYVSNEGFGSSFGDVGQWPVLRIDDEKLPRIWDVLCSKIEKSVLTIEDLEGTQLQGLTEALENHYGFLMIQMIMAMVICLIFINLF